MTNSVLKYDLGYLVSELKRLWVQREPSQSFGEAFVTTDVITMMRYVML
jgi:hypothetical protein